MNHFSFNRVPYYGLHLFTGSLGSGSVNLMIKKARELCKKRPELRVYTNLELHNFPEHTKIYYYSNVYEILDAPANSLFILDDYAFFPLNDLHSIVLSALAQSRLRSLIIFASVQFLHEVSYNLLPLVSSVYKCSFFLGYPFHYKVKDYSSLRCEVH